MALPDSGVLYTGYAAGYCQEGSDSYNNAFNRLVREFSNTFCKKNGSIDWEKLVEFNSGD